MNIVIFGAGNCGRLIAKELVAKDNIIAFIDNDRLKANNVVEIGGGVLPSILQRSYMN